MTIQNPSYLTLSAFLLACLAGSASALAQGYSPREAAHLDSGVIALRTGDVSTASRSNLLTTSNRGTLSAGMRYVIRIDGPLSVHRRALLQQTGVRLGDYLPDSAYFADLSNADLNALAELGFVPWAGEWDSAWKLEPEIGTRSFDSQERKAIASAGDVLLQAYAFPGEPGDAVAREVATIPGAQILDVTQIAEMGTVLVRMPAAKFRALARLGSVRFVEECPEITPRSNLNTEWIVQTNVTSSTPLYTAGIRGEGQVIGIMDGGFQPAHCSFADASLAITAANTPGTFPTHRKVVAYNVPFVSDTHGTHVAGTAMGSQVAGTADNTRGIAYNAKVCFRTYSSPVSSFPMDTYLNLHASQGATVHTNSWGDDGTTAYNALCRAIDVFSYNHEDNMVCFASTNLSALKNPENAKSVLAVGKSGGSGSQTGSCSTLAGPTSDGRRKPEVFAPGCSTLSSNSATSCGTTSLTGTSMASPAVAGAGALVRQYFTDGFYPTGAKVPANSFVPSGALLRAMLVNSAVDMTTYPTPNKLPPNTNEGFGRILLDNSVYLAGDARKLLVKDVRNTSAQALATGGTSNFDFKVTGSAQRLEVTMAFTDSPATIPTSFAPVNNIDLRITDPSGNVYLGNVFNATTGLSMTGGAADAINCIENTFFNAPATGVWHAQVRGTAVNVGTQGFALVVTGEVAAFVACPADLNGDSQVDDADFAIFAIAYDLFACSAPGMPAGCPSDLNTDTFVEDADFVIFATAYDAFLCP